MRVTDIEIRGGGAIAVDTRTLRATAVRFGAARAELDGIAERLGGVQLMLLQSRSVAWDAASAASMLATRLVEACDAADRIACSLREAATVYELVELNAAHHAAVLAGDRAAVARLDARRDGLLAAHPDAEWPARLADFERHVLGPGELVRQATDAGFGVGDQFGGPVGAIYGGLGAGGAALAFGVLADLQGQGRIPRDARLTPRAADVSIARLPTAAPDRSVAPFLTGAAAPRSLTDAAQRMPSGAARVRVEKYLMPDGSRQFAVYVAGTRSVAPSTRDPWDGTSNIELFSGVTSASYVATQRALADAGARPGDTVHAFGHSQGAMITAHLALEGGYDTRTSVTFGSPVQADLPETTLSVDVRHSDDPVATLAGGGHVGSVGAPGSFVVEAIADPSAGVQDAALIAHQLDAYAQTAAAVDASSDPRVANLHAVFDDLGAAVQVEVTEYAATRGSGDPDAVSPSSGAG